MINPSAGIHRSQSAEKLRRGRHLIYAINVSLAAGVFLLAVKVHAWILTGSVAIFSDAAESVVHFFIVCFSAYGVRLAQKPADRDHLYGHDRINFFSIGFEGAMIVVAALFIFYEAGGRLFAGDFVLREVESGIGYIVLAAVVNLALGYFLLRQSRRWKSDVLEANGRHVLADSMTSFGVIIGLGLAKTTGIVLFDPAAAIAVAAHILWSGAKLVRRAVGGLMDSADPETDAVLRELLDAETKKYGAHYHFLRHRDGGGRLLVDFHLLFDNDMTVARAHDISMMIERAITRRMEIPTEITTHFEPLHGHDKAHEIESLDGGDN